MQTALAVAVKGSNYLSLVVPWCLGGRTAGAGAAAAAGAGSAVGAAAAGAGSGAAGGQQGQAPPGGTGAEEAKAGSGGSRNSAGAAAPRTVSRVNMNEAGDDHVSFSARALSLSPGALGAGRSHMAWHVWLWHGAHMARVRLSARALSLSPVRGQMAANASTARLPPFLLFLLYPAPTPTPRGGDWEGAPGPPATATITNRRTLPHSPPPPDGRHLLIVTDSTRALLLRTCTWRASRVLFVPSEQFHSPACAWHRCACAGGVSGCACRLRLRSMAMAAVDQ
jgi:hypothetical protein